jgi:hypothetical protein
VIVWCKLVHISQRYTSSPSNSIWANYITSIHILIF